MAWIPTSERRPTWHILGMTAVAAALAPGCSRDATDEPASDGGASTDAAADSGMSSSLEWPHLGCDPLVPSYCLFPFPSNVYTVEDSAAPTGRRVELDAESLPPASGGGRTLPGVWGQSDGFSTGAALLAHFPGATAEGLPGPGSIERSLEPESPTVILNAETGERIPHFSELDRSGDEDAERALLIRPVVPLATATRYLVAVRDLRGAGGVLEASPAFAALRDGDPYPEDPSVDARRELYADILGRLEGAGVEPGSLQLAWDFTTASRDNITGRLVHMRDVALELAGPGGPDYTIERVDDDWNADRIAFRIDVLMKTPLFLDDPGPGGNLLLGDDGLPEVNPERPTYDVPVEILIPQSALQKPGSPLQYGHGLLGSRTQVESGHFRSFIDEYGYVFFGVDLVGMAGDDTPHIAAVLGGGELHRLSTMFDRLHQGMLNSLLAMRMMITSFAEDPTYGSLIDPSERYYHGISQGGIMGGVYMAAATDVTRGVLGVMGQPYNLLLNRSIDFDPFFTILAGQYPSALDQQLYLNLVQMLWDRLEPSGYTPYIESDTLPGTPPHQVLMRVALGDHQVTTLGGHVMARAVGARHLDTGLRDIFGLETVERVDSGSSYVESDFGLPEDPPCNIPQRLCDDPHGKVRGLEAARRQMDHFLRTGETVNYCEGGTCSFPDLSGCTGGESNAGACE